MFKPSAIFTLSAEYGETPSTMMQVDYDVRKMEFLASLVFFCIAFGVYYYPNKHA